MAYKKRHTVIEKSLQTCHTSLGDASFLEMIIKESFISIERNIFNRSVCQKVDFPYYVSYLLAMSWFCYPGNLESSEMHWNKNIMFSYELRV